MEWLRAISANVLPIAEIAWSHSILNLAAIREGYPEGTLRSVRTRAVVLPETFVIQVSVEDDSAVRAASLANAVVQEAGVFGGQAYPAYQTRQLDDAVAVSSPIRPQPVQDITLGVLAGLAVGIGVAFALGYLRLSRTSASSARVPRVAPARAS